MRELELNLTHASRSMNLVVSWS